MKKIKEMNQAVVWLILLLISNVVWVIVYILTENMVFLHLVSGVCSLISSTGIFISTIAVILTIDNKKDDDNGVEQI